MTEDATEQVQGARDKARQGKTRQDKAIQGKARQDEATDYRIGRYLLYWVGT
jgi:hypothetical protein